MEHAFIPSHGDYKKLASYQKAKIVFDGTMCFCERFYHKYDRTREQMVQAARSGKQNIVEGCMVSGTSKKSEIKLLGVARASLEELLEDYADFVRTHGLKQWKRDDERTIAIRKLAYNTDESIETYRTLLTEYTPETAANAMIVLVHQCNYLLDRQRRTLEQSFVTTGGLHERMHNARSAFRNRS
ncbi:MAG: four helix bundle protein [Deltaproteobacteria bacterium]|nr:four helix bundle protein [Deltaproteobacteria bacterium]MBN2672934.1 four helix bundle protein [Deltaproteobacteria bacterium]